MKRRNRLPEAARVRSTLTLLGEELERTLLRLVTCRDQTRVGLLARLGLLAAYDLAALILDQILAGQSALRVLRRTVEYLRLRADREHRSVHVSNEIEDFFPIP